MWFDIVVAATNLEAEKLLQYVRGTYVPCGEEQHRNRAHRTAKALR